MAKKTAAGGKLRKTGPKTKQKAPATSEATPGGDRYISKFADKKKPEAKIQPARIEKKRG